MLRKAEVGIRGISQIWVLDITVTCTLHSSAQLPSFTFDNLAASLLRELELEKLEADGPGSF